MIILSASNPRYSRPDESAVDLVVQFAEFAEPLPFTATADDVEAHGRELFARAVAGDFGTVAPYAP